MPPVSGDLAGAIDAMVSSVAASSSARIELLGFPGCPNLPLMRRNLAAALDRIGGGLAIQDLNQQALAADDPRNGFPSPTILVNGRDLFGMAAQAKPALGCRVYPGGVPGTEVIAERLRDALGEHHP